MEKTIGIRLAVVIDAGGEWNATGWGGARESDPAAAMEMASQCVGSPAIRYWIDAELPIGGDGPGDGAPHATVRLATESSQGIGDEPRHT